MIALAVPRSGQARTAIVATQLDYSAAPGCPGVDVFEGIVRRRLGYDTFRPDATNLVVVRIEAAGRALEGQIEWRNAAGASIGGQTFPSRSGDCGELTLAMGFALALQIQLLASNVPEPAQPPAPAPPPPAPAAPPPPVETALSSPPAAPPAEPGAALSVGLGASAGLGISSEPTALGRLFATASWSHLALEVGGEMSAPTTTHRPDGAGFSQEDLLATGAVCGVRGDWRGCAVGKLGELRVTGQNVAVPLSAAGFMAQAGLRLGFSRPLGHNTYIAARAEGLTRLTEGIVTLDGAPVWTTPRFAALLGIDVGLRFR